MVSPVVFPIVDYVFEDFSLLSFGGSIGMKKIDHDPLGCEFDEASKYESLTKVSPILVDIVQWSSDENWIDIPVAPIISAIRQKHKSQRNDPIVEP